jgi:hypothetical protein
MLIVMPLIFLLIGAGVGYWLTSIGQRVSVWLLVAAAAMVFAALIVVGRMQSDGYSAIGYAIAAVLMVAPAGIGALMGLVICHIRSRREAADD